MTTTSTVSFFFETKGFSFTNRTLLKTFISSIFIKEKKKLHSLNYIFVSDKRLLEINQQFLQHDYYTDIITFEMGKGPATEGEIYISIDRIKDNAQQLGNTFKAELHRVIFHGALHLCGYGDKTANEEKTMRKKEDHYLSKYFK
jgi:rRNA maturation RNase YbeY